MDIFALLKDLGIVWAELFTQMAIFIVAYMGLSFFVFRPYGKALAEREKSTEGNAELADRLKQEAVELQAAYEAKAKELNTRFKAIYDESRGRAAHEREQMLSAARTEAEVLLASSNQEIAKAFAKARNSLAVEVPAVASAITTQLVSREVKQ